MQPQATCRQCGVTFIPRLGGRPQVYCTKRCRNKAFARPRKLPTLAIRFWRHVDIREDNACWPWLGGQTPGGYGVFSIGGSRARGGYQTTAHRVALALHRGVPVEQIAQSVRHTCDNPPCQNPAHLTDGSQSDNLEDMRLKGRRKRTGPAGGELNDAKASEIRTRYAAGGITQQELAREYGVNQRNISRVILRQIYKHAP